MQHGKYVPQQVFCIVGLQPRTQLPEITCPSLHHPTAQLIGESCDSGLTNNKHFVENKYNSTAGHSQEASAWPAAIAAMQGTYRSPVVVNAQAWCAQSYCIEVWNWRIQQVQMALQLAG
jgi:hypothetical protein